MQRGSGTVWRRLRADRPRPGLSSPPEQPSLSEPGDTVSALRVCLLIFAGTCAATWLLSLATREHSWVDRIWSIVPIAYVAVFAGSAGFADARLDTMLALVTLWGARLTFNFARKGGYAPGGEDY